jgi:hypothetical protein
MSRSKHTEAQMIAAVKQMEAGRKASLEIRGGSKRYIPGRWQRTRNLRADWAYSNSGSAEPEEDV